MAENFHPRTGKTRWDEAFEQVDRWLVSSFVGVIRLNSAELRSHYPYRALKAGWRVAIEFTTGTRRFDILVAADFPFNPPRLALVDRPAHLTWPHLEADGYLCLLSSSATMITNDPISVVKNLLAEAARWFEASENADNIDDFRSEFTSYWPTDSTSPEILSLIEAKGPSRVISIYRMKRRYIIAEDADTLTRWLNHSIHVKMSKPREFEPALLVWMPNPLLPSDYPYCSADIIALIGRSGLESELNKLAADQLDPIIVVLGALSQNGPALAAVVLRQPSASPRRGGPRRTFGSPERGFRSGRTPPHILAQRRLGSSQLIKADVERIDASWIHGRDWDTDACRLRAARVVMVGCGSLGGLIAMSLAQTGIGSLDLIDPETLRAANVGRHPLGTSEIGQAKSVALATRIKRDYPHILRAEGHFKRWEDVDAHCEKVISEANLIISTIGDWSSEATLNAWRQDRGRTPDVLFGWTEPHAIAGHVVGLVGSYGCLACGLSPWGEPLFSVAEWPARTGLRSEPACGVSFQPYGPVQAAYITSLITEAAVDVLLQRAVKPFHRIWVAHADVFQRAGSIWSRAWMENYGDNPIGAQMVEREWPIGDDCQICGGGQF